MLYTYFNWIVVSTINYIWYVKPTCVGSDGLGFSVTTRDNLAGEESPIYIKNILPKGAAVRNATLRTGDRLLKVRDHFLD